MLRSSTASIGQKLQELHASNAHAMMNVMMNCVPEERATAAEEEDWSSYEDWSSEMPPSPSTDTRFIMTSVGAERRWTSAPSPRPPGGRCNKHVRFESECP